MTRCDGQDLPFPLHTACQSLRTDTHRVSSAASFPATEKLLEWTREKNVKTGTQSSSSFQLVPFLQQAYNMGLRSESNPELRSPGPKDHEALD